MSIILLSFYYYIYHNIIRIYLAIEMLYIFQHISIKKIIYKSIKVIFDSFFFFFFFFWKRNLSIGTRVTCLREPKSSFLKLLVFIYYRPSVPNRVDTAMCTHAATAQCSLSLSLSHTHTHFTQTWMMHLADCVPFFYI